MKAAREGKQKRQSVCVGRSDSRRRDVKKTSLFWLSPDAGSADASVCLCVKEKDKVCQLVVLLRVLNDLIRAKDSNFTDSSYGGSQLCPYIFRHYGQTPLLLAGSTFQHDVDVCRYIEVVHSDAVYSVCSPKSIGFCSALVSYPGCTSPLPSLKKDEWCCFCFRTVIYKSSLDRVCPSSLMNEVEVVL